MPTYKLSSKYDDDDVKLKSGVNLSIHRLLAASALSFLLAPMPALAADSKGVIFILSLGVKPCGKVAAEFEKNDFGKLTNSIWVGGYLTAINSKVFKGHNVAEGTDPEARDRWIYNYCKANPLDGLYDATNALVAELTRRAQLK